MPEIKRHFRAGKMNKDLDERLIPNGEYRDALNVEIATSDGDDVGALQTVLGNDRQKVTNYADGILTETAARLGAAWTEAGKCIGSFVDTKNDYIYYFVSDTNFGAIFEFQQKNPEISSTQSGVIKPVIVDKTSSCSLLNFTSNRITGINVVDGILFWTDGSTEPRKINIEKFKNYTNEDLTQTTQVDGSNFTVAQTTVIKQNPKLAPQLEMLRSKHTLPTMGDTTYKFTDSGGVTFTNGYIIDGTPSAKLSVTPTPSWQVGDSIKLKHEDSDGVEYEIRATIYARTGAIWTGNIEFSIVIDSIPDEVPNSAVTWRAELVDEDPLFETKFPRFSYRYKYSDGEYSCFAPWTEVAFLPGYFDYEPKKGYNLGMTNELRSLKIKNFTTGVPWDVVEIDILYKESNSNNIYTVKTLKKPGAGRVIDQEWVDNELEITTEVIHKVVAPNQSLRPWDNVPLKALAQELTANRLMYGNYTENFNMVDYNGDEISPKFNFAITERSDRTTVDASIGHKSIKTQRTYQLGVVYRDEYGRETPVFTDSDTGALKLSKEHANGRNQITAGITSDPPAFAKSYKYYVKETSSEYYNLAMDRYYPAEDGNIWLSFPSSERNKITEESHIELKKEHDNDEFVGEPARYKVIAIENEAPEFLKRTWVHKAIIRAGVARYEAKDSDGDDFPNMESYTGGPFINFNGAPQPNRNYVDIPKVLWDAGHLSSYAQELHSMPDLAVKFKTSSAKSQWYEVKGMSLINVGADQTSNYWRIEVKDVFSSDVDFVTEDSNGDGTKDQVKTGVDVVIGQREIKNKPEFAGRFFVKIHRDSIFNQYIWSPATQESLFEKYVTTIHDDTTHVGTVTGTPLASGVAIDGQNMSSSTLKSHWQHPVAEGHISGIRTRGWFIDASRYISGSNNGTPACRKKTYKVGANITGGSGVSQEGLDYLNLISTSPALPRYMGWEGYVTEDQARVELGRGFKEGERFMNISYHGWGKREGNKDRWTKVWDKFETEYHPEYYGFIRDGLQTAGSKFRMSCDADAHVYTVIGWCRSYTVAWSNSMSVDCREARGKYGTQRIIRWTLLLDKEIQNSSVDAMDCDGNAMVFLEHLDSDDNAGDFSSNNPAIWETEPKENIALDIYHEASDAYDITNPGTATAAHVADQRLDWYNCFSFGNGVESDRIRDDFNEVQIDNGPRASAPLAEQYKEETRATDIIYSGLFNSRSGVNRTNQFIQAEKITKSLNPRYGSIQKLHARNTDVIALCEDKILNIPCNKDVLFNADGNPNVTASNRVLGTAQPYVGEYGISKDPGSFASYGYMAYFTDRNRGTVIRMERNGLFPIAEYGMVDYFKDKMRDCVDIVGSYDDNRDLYNLTLKGDDTDGSCTSNASNNVTISFSEKTKGWTSFKSFIQEDGQSLNNKYYTWKKGDLWLHHNNPTRNNFYDEQHQSEFVVILNEEPSMVKSFNTLNYEGSQANVTLNSAGTNVLNPDGINQDIYYNNTAKVGWYCDYIRTDQSLEGQEGKVPEFLDKENKWFNYIQGIETTTSNLDQNEFSVQGIGNITVGPSGTPGTAYQLTITENQI